MLPIALVQCRAANNNSGARYQNVTTTGSRSANGFSGELNNLAKPMSAEEIIIVDITEVLEKLANTHVTFITVIHLIFAN